MSKKQPATSGSINDPWDQAEMMTHFPHLEAAGRRRLLELGPRPRRPLREQKEEPAEDDPLQTNEGFLQVLWGGEMPEKAGRRRGALSNEAFLEQLQQPDGVCSFPATNPRGGSFR